MQKPLTFFHVVVNRPQVQIVESLKHFIIQDSSLHELADYS